MALGHVGKTAILFSSFIGAVTIFVVIAVISNNYNTERLQSLPDPSAVSPDFEPRPMPVLEMPLPIDLPKKRPEGNFHILQGAVPSTADTTLADNVFQDVLKQAAEQVHPESFKKFPNSLKKNILLSPHDELLKVILSDQVMRAGSRINKVKDLIVHIPFLTNPQLCSVDKHPQNVLLTLKWALKTQQMISRFLYNKDEEERTEDNTEDKIEEKTAEVITLIQPLCAALNHCGMRWERFIKELPATERKPYLHLASEWIRAPLTDELYESAWRSSPKYYHHLFNRIDFKLVPNEFTKDGKKLAAFPYKSVRNVTLSFMNKDKDGNYRLPGPVWYKEAMDSFVELFSNDQSIDQNWWHQHLLQTLPIEMIGPWAEDFMVRASIKSSKPKSSQRPSESKTNLNSTEALNWLHWTARCHSGRLYDLVRGFIKTETETEIGEIPNNPLKNDTLSPLPNLSQFISPSGTLEQYTHQIRIRQLVSKETLQSLKGRDVAKKVEVDPKKFASQALSKLDKIFESPGDFASKLFYVSFANHPDVTQEHHKRDQIFFGTLTPLLFEIFGFFKQTKSRYDLKGDMNPEFMRIVANCIAKCLQNGIKPPVFFSSKLTAILTNLVPPSRRQCLNYATSIGMIRESRDSDNSFEPKFAGLDIPEMFLQSTAVRSCSARSFDYGQISTDKQVKSHRRVVSTEWYLKRCRQLFMDTFYSYMTPSGWTYFDSDWIIQMCVTSNSKNLLDSLISSIQFSQQHCLNAKVGMTNIEPAMAEALKSLKTIKPDEVLLALSSSRFEPPSLFKGRFKFTCRTKPDGDMTLKKGSNEFEISAIYTSMKVFKTAIETAIKAAIADEKNPPSDLDVTQPEFYLSNCLVDPKNPIIPSSSNNDDEVNNREETNGVEE